MAVLARGWNIADGFTAMMAQHVRTESKQQIQGFIDLFGELIKKIIEQENKEATVKPKETSTSATLKFKKEEIAQIGAGFQKKSSQRGASQE